jgi:hypothetical protein
VADDACASADIFQSSSATAVKLSLGGERGKGIKYLLYNDYPVAKELCDTYTLCTHPPKHRADGQDRRGFPQGVQQPSKALDPPTIHLPAPMASYARW